MTFVEKLRNYRADVVDVGFIKIALFAAGLFIAKIWEPVLSLDWYWYLVIWIAAAVKPVYSFFKLLSR